ncbi:MAG: tRNA 2-thiouridine(34) synthase MnmA [bacterium]|nr:tRNA 2-thiouridine(34) synthase MnmA [bacterium]
MDYNRTAKRVFVGLSGGVDSSVSAALLKRAGYNVTGVFIRVWQPDFFECGWRDDRLDAMRICAKLDIPFRELNLEKEYKREVVDYMIREYKAGKTPNPDVMCNRFIKFGAFYNWARTEGADFIATGHYARIQPLTINYLPLTQRPEVKSQRLKVKSHGLFVGSDPQKDQSYFLWQIRQEQLPHILFPVGGMKKPEVRKLAKKFGLITADKKDSQGLCFIGKVDMKEFLSHYIKEKPGKVLNEKGNVIGEHKGIFFYTIGERFGLPLFLRGGMRGSEKAQYVIAKDFRKNTLTVSEKTKGLLLGATWKVRIERCNWITSPKKGSTYSARLRYRQPFQNCKMKSVTAHKALISFAKPQQPASGQSLVLYDGEMMLGGGIIV